MIIDLNAIHRCDNAKELEKKIEQLVIDLKSATVKGKRVSGLALIDSQVIDDD